MLRSCQRSTRYQTMGTPEEALCPKLLSSLAGLDVGLAAIVLKTISDYLPAEDYFESRDEQVAKTVI